MSAIATTQTPSETLKTAAVAAEEPAAGATTPPDQKSLRSSPTEPPTQNTLIKTILARHSTRVFHKDVPVPLDIIEECLELAQHAPSSTNIQPWRLTFTAGEKLDRVREAMMASVLEGVPSTVPAIPEKFRHYRSDIGHALYGPEGYDIPRADKEGTKKAALRNFDFFGAPMIAVVGIDESLMRGSDVMSVGLYLQTLVLLLTERGLGTCMEVSTSGYPQVLRKELGVPEDEFVLCTLSIGYEDDTQHVNSLKMQRNQWKEHVKFVME